MINMCPLCRLSGSASHIVDEAFVHYTAVEKSSQQNQAY